MAKMSLPKWVVSNDESVRREAARARDLSMDERSAALSAVCRATESLLRDPERLKRAMAPGDPLPESSVRALSRLRAEHRARRGRTS